MDEAGFPPGMVQFHELIVLFPIDKSVNRFAVLKQAFVPVILTTGIGLTITGIVILDTHPPWLVTVSEAVKFPDG